MNARGWIAGALLAGLLAAPAVADQTDPEAGAVGYQVERSELAVVALLVEAVPAGADRVREARFAVIETIRGDAAPGSDLRVLLPDDGRPAPWLAGAEHLLFLVPASDGGWRPHAGSASVRVLPATGPARRMLDLARRIAEVIPEGDRPGDPGRYLRLLLGWMAEEDPGVVFSAATDFSRRLDLHRHLTDEDRAGLLGSFRRHPFGKASKEALLLAVADAGCPGAAAELVRALGEPGGRALRATVAEALERLHDPAAPGLVARAIEGVEGGARADLTLLLGAVGGEESLPLVRALVSDPSSEVRVQAAHALGLIARRVREADPGRVIPGRRELTGLLGAAACPNEAEASLWALAQLDDPEAFALLRRLAADDPRDFVRRHAERYLRRPRLSLILD